jgi:hypothetical protein
MLIDYDFTNISLEDNVVGVEFMTPAVTSSNLMEIVSNQVPVDSAQERAFSQLSFSDIVETVVRLNNPHIAFFDSAHHGYSIVEFSRTYCGYLAYAVDKNDAQAYAALPLPGAGAVIQENAVYLPYVIGSGRGQALSSDSMHTASPVHSPELKEAEGQQAEISGLAAREVLRRLWVPVNVPLILLAS